MKDKMSAAEFLQMKASTGSEYDIYKKIAEYMAVQYPTVIYHFDLAGANMSMAQAGKNNAIQMAEKDIEQVHFNKRGKLKKQTIKFPDFQICRRSFQGEFIGLFLEIKKEGIYKKDGSTCKTEHIRQQKKILHRLNSQGYFAEFAIGVAQAINFINYYLTGHTNCNVAKSVCNSCNTTTIKMNGEKYDYCPKCHFCKKQTGLI